MGPFRRSASAHDKAVPAEPETEAPEAPELPDPLEPQDSAPEPEPEPHVEFDAAASAEYRRVGDDLALLTIEIPTRDAAGAAAAELVAPEGVAIAHPAPIAVTLQPEAGLARLVFAVGRHLPPSAGDRLAIAAGPHARFTVPAPVLRPAVGAEETDIGDATVSTLAGEELFGLVTMLEKRCSVAERIAEDFRAQPTESQKLAQAYREVWDVRALLDSREETYRRSAETVEAAEAGLAASVAEADELAHERDDAQATADLLGGELEATRAAVEEWSAEAERARTHLAAAVERAEELETERDEALALALEYETSVADARSAAEASAEEAATAGAELAAAVARADAMQRERDEAYGGVDALKEQIDAARMAAEEAESRLESERTLYEARIVSGVEAERKLRLEVEELNARLGERRKARSVALRPQPGAVTESFVNAQQERLRQTTLDQQRAEVAALERQLERLKQGSPQRTAGR